MINFFLLKIISFIFIIYFIISKLRLTSHPRSTVVLLDTGTPGTSKEIYSEDAEDGTRTRNPSVINRALSFYLPVSILFGSANEI